MSEEETTATILKFPKERIIREPPQGAVEEAVSRREKEQIEEIYQDILQSAFNECINYGFDVTTNEFVKGFSYLAQVLQAVVYQNFKLEHSLQPMLNETIEVLDESEIEAMKKIAQEDELSYEE